MPRYSMILRSLNLQVERLKNLEHHWDQELADSEVLDDIDVAVENLEGVLSNAEEVLNDIITEMEAAEAEESEDEDEEDEDENEPF